VNAPFRTPRLHIAPQAIAPIIVADLFRDLDEAEATARQIRAEIGRQREKFMSAERCYGMDLPAYRREIERRAGQ
jgi:hypothetical protein